MEKRIYIEDNATNFLIDETGRLRNEKTKRYLKGGINKGYHFYNLHFRGKQYTFYTHRLVAQEFLDNPNNLPIVHHKDGDKLNNVVWNLEWVSVEDHQKTIDFSKVNANKEKLIRIAIEDYSETELAQFRNSPYYATKTGEILNLEKRIKLRPSKSGNYYRVPLSYGLGGKKFLVHRVIWESFNGPIPEGFDVDHIDGDPSNNCLDNLQAINHQQNCIKASHGQKAIYSVDENTRDKVMYTAVREAERITGLTSGAICAAIANNKILDNKRWYYNE